MQNELFEQHIVWRKVFITKHHSLILNFTCLIIEHSKIQYASTDKLNVNFSRRLKMTTNIQYQYISVRYNNSSSSSRPSAEYPSDYGI